MTKFDALKLDDDDALTIAYQSGFYDGKKAAAQEPTKYSFKAHWEEDGCIGVVAAIERLDGGVHLLKDIIDAPQPAQEPVAWCSQCGHKCPLPAQEPVAHLCGPDENGLFGLPTEDKACKDCFPVYRQLPQRPWVGLMRGARVEGDTVVIKVQSNNEARLLCSELVNEMEKNT